MNHLLNNLTSLEEVVTGIGQPGFRAGQLRKWLFQQRVLEFEQMTDLPGKFREQLQEEYSILTTEIARHETCDDGTEKLLLKLADGGMIECVLLRDGHRRTICVSSQVGCAMGCVFCASGLDGVMRNLTGGEIIEQMLLLSSLLPPEERLSHIVMMGMGEPLANLDNVLKALEVASSPEGLGISARRITISTVGLPPAINRLAKLNSRYHLAISLHAPNDELRTEIVPVNAKIGIDDLMNSAQFYFETTGRRLTFEYVLLADINDSEEHAIELADLLKGRASLLNVIPYNPVAGLPYRTPSSKAIRRFRETLERRSIVVKFRQRKGDKINAACGQLRRSQVNSVVDATTLPLVEPNQSAGNS
ncbi:MAG: 23S rRNA (adenine(2503)-C(2))-methyltransferase RlmN [Planctomycetota bacterium]